MASKEMIAAVAKEIAFAMNGTHASYNEATFARYDRGAEVALNAIAALPQGEDDPERCVICDERLEDGDKVYWSSNDDGHMHAECATSYVDEDGRETQAPPTPFTFKASEPASPIEAQAAQIASLSAKLAEVQRENADLELIADENADNVRLIDKIAKLIGIPHDQELTIQHVHVWKHAAEARASELQREVERLERENAAAKEAIRSLGSGLGRAALQQEGKSDE